MAEISTKEKLLQAALELFSQKGYSATSVDEIGEAVGMTGPSIYKYFKGKAALLEALTEKTDSAYREKMKLSPDEVAGISNASELKAFSMAQIGFTMYDSTVIMLRKMFTIEQFRNKYMSCMATVHQYANLIGVYTGIFGNLIKNGKAIGDPGLLALEYVAPITLLIQVSDREPEKRDEIMKQIERHMDFFIERNIKD